MQQEKKFPLGSMFMRYGINKGCIRTMEASGVRLSQAPNDIEDAKAVKAGNDAIARLVR